MCACVYLVESRDHNLKDQQVVDFNIENPSFWIPAWPFPLFCFFLGCVRMHFSMHPPVGQVLHVPSSMWFKRVRGRWY